MKRLLCLLALLPGCIGSALAGWTNNSISFGGQTRAYRTYVPAAYNAANPATLIVVLHGLGGSMNDAANVGITPIADTANIILLSPQALDFNSPLGVVQAAWNSGIVINLPGMGPVPVNNTVDDVGFIKAMMDAARAEYSVNPARVYVCGVSMGGFMTQRLACEEAGRFAAAASIMGTYALALPPCNPGKMLPVAHFHGTDDEVVSWNGSLLFGTGSFPVGLSVDTLMAKWVALDGCNPTPQHDVWPDSDNDGLYAEHYSYMDAGGRSRVELFKVNKGTHSWYQSSNTHGDIDYASEIWKFFNKQYQTGATAVEEHSRTKAEVSLYPNPAADLLTVRSSIAYSDIRISDLYGRAVWSGRKNTGADINISSLSPGIYLVRLYMQQQQIAVAKFVKQ